MDSACILVVDDDREIARAIEKLFLLEGFKVKLAFDGMEALEAINSCDIQLIIMDVMMPKMDGYEAIKQIRKTVKGRNTPIIALTAKAMSDDRDKCLSAGANDYLTKPVEAGRLLSMVKVWMS